jgi:hypothetical protein
MVPHTTHFSFLVQPIGCLTSLIGPAQFVSSRRLSLFLDLGLGLGPVLVCILGVSRDTLFNVETLDCRSHCLRGSPCLLKSVSHLIRLFLSSNTTITIHNMHRALQVLSEITLEGSLFASSDQNARLPPSLPLQTLEYVHVYFGRQAPMAV